MSTDYKAAHVREKVIRCHQKWPNDMHLGDNTAQWVMYKSSPLKVSSAAFTHLLWSLSLDICTKHGTGCLLEKAIWLKRKKKFLSLKCEGNLCICKTRIVPKRDIIICYKGAIMELNN